MQSVGAPHSPTLDALPPRAGYDIAARHYDAWQWQEFWRRNEVPVVLDLVAPAGRTRDVLDLGTGTGLYLDRLATADDACAVGVDVSENMLAVARAKLGRRASLVQGDVTALPFASHAFDLVVAARVLSHIGRLAAALDEAARVTRVGGHLVVTDVDATHDYLATRLTVERRTVSIDTFKWTDAQLAAAAASAGFVLERHEQITATNARWLPDDGSLPSIDRSGARAVGQILLFRRTRA